METVYHLNHVYNGAPLEYGGIYVAQIGRMYCTGETEVPPHAHTNLYELTTVTDGSGVVYTGGVGTAVHRGDIYLSLPGDIHRICSDGNAPLKFDFFAFYAEEPFFRSELERVAAEFHGAETRVFRDERILPLLSCAMGEIEGREEYARELLSSVFRQILIHVFRGFRQEKAPQRTENVSRADILCYRLMNYMDTHMYSMKKLDELAEITGYSYGYLSDLFRKTTGNTLTGYYHAKKLDAARLLLLENKLQITEIAETLNYASVYALSKAFRRQYGLSPRQYRLQYGG